MKYLDIFEDVFLVLALLAMGLILLVQIVSRYCFNYPLVWSEELARFIFVWMAFIGASFGVKNKTHINMALLFNKMPRRAKMAVQIVNNILAMTIFLMIVVAGWELAVDQAVIRSSAMGVSMSCFFLALPIGCSLMTLRLALDTIRVVRTKGEEL